MKQLLQVFIQQLMLNKQLTLIPWLWFISSDCLILRMLFLPAVPLTPLFPIAHPSKLLSLHEAWVGSSFSSASNNQQFPKICLVWEMFRCRVLDCQNRYDAHLIQTKCTNIVSSACVKTELALCVMFISLNVLLKPKQNLKSELKVSPL